MSTTRNLVLSVPQLTETPSSSPSPPPSPPPAPQNLRRADFLAEVPDFVFGTGTGAYQVEGAAAEDGRGISVWDDWTLKDPSHITDGSNGNVACDMYHRYKEDITAMKKMGFDAYRFSLSWTRILPGGRACNGINRKGIDYYNDLIDTVIENGMKPCVTLFHWDTPSALEKEYDGFLSKKILEDFRKYVELCFWEFGDRVKWWTTINEPWTYSAHGYVNGLFPPGETAGEPDNIKNNMQAHRSDLHILPAERIKVSTGTVRSPNPAKDAYTVTRNLLLAHATAVHSYRTKFKDTQKGVIGIVLNSHWHWPWNADSLDDQAACTRGVDFMLGWFLDPILTGAYPQTMQEYVPADNLAGFSHREMHLLQGSIDYLGLNYYTTNYAKNDPDLQGEGYNVDQKISFLHTNNEDVPIGEATGSSWLYVAPTGLYEHLQYLANKYTNLPPIYITENGVSQANDHTLIAKDVCADTQRKQYHQDHLYYLLKAMIDSSDPDRDRSHFNNKLNIRGYFVWSWCDNFEWREGYTARFGINYIDYMNNLTRYPKNSAMWFMEFLNATPNKVSETKGSSKTETKVSSKKRSRKNNDLENLQAEKRARGRED